MCHSSLGGTVRRRRVAAVLVDAVAWYGELLASGGRSPLFRQCFPSQAAYRMARHRLLKAGVLAYRRTRGRMPVLAVADQPDHAPSYLDPERFWNQKWNGCWYVLFYDVPERDRRYRDSLRRVLDHLHLGSLQKSVWISPRDLRPVYDDLVRAAGVSAVAYLLEAKTVLRQSPRELVEAAWDFEKLRKRQSRYAAFWAGTLDRLRQGKPTPAELRGVAEQELLAYRAAMEDDPILPGQLLPRGYAGRDAFRVHRDLVRLITHRMKRAPQA